MKMMSPQVDFCSGNIYVNLSFQIKKKCKFHTLVRVGFCTPEMSTKFWGFPAGMDFGTK